MVEKILISKPKGKWSKWATYDFRLKGYDGIYCCNEDDWKLYEIEWKMFKNGVPEKDIKELEERARDVCRRDYEEEEND